MFFGEGGDEFDVFCVFDGAGGIDDAATGFEAGEGVGENGGLDFGELIDVGGLKSPADIDATADHAGVGTRDIEENGIEGLVEFFRCGFAPIMDGNFIGGDAEPCEVITKAGYAFFVRVRASEAFTAA